MDALLVEKNKNKREPGGELKASVILDEDW